MFSGRVFVDVCWDRHFEVLWRMLGPKGLPKVSKSEPKWSPEAPKADLGDSEIHIVFTVRTPHKAFPGEVRRRFVLVVLPSRLSGAIWEALV